MDTIEKFYIYKATRDNNQINDKNTVKPNVVFDTTAHEEASRACSNR